MPVQFLTAEQRQNYGRYSGEPNSEELARYFHLDDADLTLIASKRSEHNRLGFAVQLTTVRFLGTFLEDLTAVPASVVLNVGKQLQIQDTSVLANYQNAKQRWEHIIEIRTRYGFKEWDSPSIGFRLTRWLYAGPAPSKPVYCLIELPFGFCLIKSYYPAVRHLRDLSPNCAPVSKHGYGSVLVKTYPPNRSES